MSFTGTDDGLDVSLDIELVDPGSLDELTAIIDWGDGTIEPATRSTLRDSRARFTGAHRYDTAGTYDIEVCGTDDDGGKGCRTQKIVLIATAAPTTPPTTTIPASPTTASPGSPTAAPPSAGVNASGDTATGVVDRSDVDGSLPRTGAPSVPFALAGLALVLLGSLLLVSRRFSRP